MNASVQKIVSITKHPNADSLDIAKVLGYECIVKLNQFKAGNLVVFIEPDTVLPDAPWAAFYKSKSSRVKSVKLRGCWSFGIVESFSNLNLAPSEEGTDLTEILGVTKYEPPLPNDLSAKGTLPHGIGKTDEVRWQGVRNLRLGDLVDVTEKIDGSSMSVFCKKDEMTGEWETGVTSRTMNLKMDLANKYISIAEKLQIVPKLLTFCQTNNINICIRGELFGNNTQNISLNPWAKKELGWAMFSVWLINERRYARKGEKLYFKDLAATLDLPTVPILEENVVLTKELIHKYDEEMTELRGSGFEGVVINGHDFSFKVINKHYDSKK
jgi:RNA ligase (TIGR02306 family)